MTTLETYRTARDEVIAAEAALRADKQAKARDPGSPFIDEAIARSLQRVERAAHAYRAAQRGLTMADVRALNLGLD